jgi:glucokinase
MNMLLAGDIGGTKSRLAIFSDDVNPQKPIVEEVLPSSQFSGIEALISEFLKRSGLSVERVCLAVAGPTLQNRAMLTNLPWILDAESIREAFGFRSVHLLNDLAATARAVPLLKKADILTLSAGEPAIRGAIAVIAPGTGLGEAFLIWDGERYREQASEGGHADFAPGSALEMDLLLELRKEADHVSYESVCSGPGLWRLYRFLLKRGMGSPASLAGDLPMLADPVPAIVETALAEKNSLSAEAVRLFVSILGREAGNLALKMLASGGVFLGGGIAPRIIPFLEEETFLAAFRRKGPMAGLLSLMPVHLILDPRAALMGAADLGMEKK